MKRLFTLRAITASAIALAVFTQASAQTAATEKGTRKFEIIVNNADRSAIESTDRGLETARSRSLGSDLLTSLSSTGVGQVVNISTNLLGFGLEYLGGLLKGNRKDWYREATKQCRFKKVLSTDSRIDDFYAHGSHKGAMDPEGLKFDGFGCRNYIESDENPGHGNEAFYIYCSLRRDPEGIRHITDHSKFLVQIDTLMFTPRFCDLPCDSTGRLDMQFDFNGRRDLTLNIKTRIYSSWVNEAIMVTRDQLLGEFNITARIDPERMRDGRFVYSAADGTNADLVSITGDCFIVPRSFTGTADAASYSPVWGTGQYRIEMEINETCAIDDDYYTTNGKWDKNRWKPEWDKMKKARNKKGGFMKQAWQTVTTAYTDNGWIAIIAEPVTKTLISSETAELKKLVGLPVTTTQQQTKPGTSATPTHKP